MTPTNIELVRRFVAAEGPSTWRQVLDHLQDAHGLDARQAECAVANARTERRILAVRRGVYVASGEEKAPCVPIETREAAILRELTRSGPTTLGRLARAVGRETGASYLATQYAVGVLYRLGEVVSPKRGVWARVTTVRRTPAAR